MMARWQGEGEGHTACPQPSELSAEGHDEMMRTEGAGGLPGGGVAAAGVGKRSITGGGTAEAKCGGRICLFTQLPAPPDPHISLHDSQLQIFHGSQLPMPLRFYSWLFLLLAV